MALDPVARRDDVDVLRTQVAAVLDGEARVAFCYLFGSFATGTASANSDVDLAVALTEPVDLFEEARLHERLAQAVGGPTDLVILDHAPLWLRFRIVGEGIVLHAHDEAARVRFRARTEHDHLDMKPYRDAYLAAVRERARRGTLTHG